MPVVCVLESCYHQLITRLRPAIPKSLSMIAALENVIKGRVKANFFVDEWPEFSALVCQYIWPRRSDVADIGAFATSSEALLSVLSEGNLVTWGERQEFQRIEDRHADFLLKHLKSSDSGTILKRIHERSVVVYESSHLLENLKILNITDPNSDNIVEVVKEKVTEMVPDGLTLGRLEPHHSQMVASLWPRLDTWPNKEPYFRDLIKTFHCPALYATQNPSVPMSFIVQFPSNQHFAFTDKHYQGNKLSNFLAQIIFVNMVWVEKFWPFEEETTHPGRIALVTEMFGGTLTDYKVNDLVIDPFVDSKL